MLVLPLVLPLAQEAPLLHHLVLLLVVLVLLCYVDHLQAHLNFLLVVLRQQLPLLLR